MNIECFPSHQQAKLVNTHIIYRHGDRAPLTLYPKSNNKPDFWPKGLGQLTNQGQLQQIRLGQYLRERYSNFLNFTYVAAEITVRSSDLDRTLISAYLNLLGLYPTSKETLEIMLSKLDNEDQWPPMLPWQPIPVHTVPFQGDHLMGVSDCSRFNEALQKIKESELLRNVNKQYRELFDQLTIWTGIEIYDLFSATRIVDTILIENSHNVAPSWISPSLIEQLKAVLGASLYYRTSSAEASRLRGGPFISDVMNNIKSVITHQPNARKANFYSGHDSTLSAILSFLGVNYKHQPAYCSTIFFDLYYLEETDTYALKMEYLDSMNSSTIKQLRFPPCLDLLCPVETLTSWLETRLPSSNMTEECMAQANH